MPRVSARAKSSSTSPTKRIAPKRKAVASPALSSDDDHEDDRASSPASSAENSPKNVKTPAKRGRKSNAVANGTPKTPKSATPAAKRGRKSKSAVASDGETETETPKKSKNKGSELLKNGKAAVKSGKIGDNEENCENGKGKNAKRAKNGKEEKQSAKKVKKDLSDEDEEMKEPKKELSDDEMSVDEEEQQNAKGKQGRKSNAEKEQKKTPKKLKKEESEDDDMGGDEEKQHNAKGKRGRKSNAEKNQKKTTKKIQKEESEDDEEEEEKGKSKENGQTRGGRARGNLRTNVPRKRYTEDFTDEEDDDDEYVEEKKSKVKKPKATGKRKRVIPDDGSDSEDDYKPESDGSAESDFVLSDAVSEHDSDPASGDSDDDDVIIPKGERNMPKGGKGAKTGKKRGTGKKTKGRAPPEAMATDDQDQDGNKEARTDCWPHLKYDFLQPENIKDKDGRRPDDPDYDPKTLYVPEDFIQKQNPSMQQWWKLKSEHFDTVLFFKVGKFYEMYHMDAVIAVNEISLFFMKFEYARAGFPEMNHPKWSDILIEKGFKVARIEQTENPDMAAERCKNIENVQKVDKLVKREICQISTKGTRVYSPQDAESFIPTSRFLLSIVERQEPRQSIMSYGVCFLDTSIGEFNIGQFLDDRCNSKLLTLLAHYPVAHIISERRNLSQNTLKIFDTVVPFARKETFLKDTQFWSPMTVLKNLREDEYFKKGTEGNFAWPEGLQPFVNDDGESDPTPAQNMDLALHALGGCVYLLKDYQLDYQLLTQGLFKLYTPPGFSDKTEPKSVKSTRFGHNMVLDSMTINNIRILGEDGSLIKALDQTCTMFGKRLLREWICKPSCRKSVIIERQLAITELVDNPDIVRKARNKLSNVPDLERLLSKIHAQGNPAKLKHHPDSRAILFDGFLYSRKTIIDFINILNGFKEALEMIDYFEELQSSLINNCTKHEPDGNFPDLKETLNHFLNAFDQEKAKREGVIILRPGVDKDYDDVLLELEEIQKEIDEFLKKQKKYFGCDLKFYGQHCKRYQLEVPESHISKAGKEYEEFSSKKGFKRYYTPESRSLLARQMDAEERKIQFTQESSRRLFIKFCDHFEKWNRACNKIAILDCLMSLSEYAQSCDTCVPIIHDDLDKKERFIEIKNGRHPCIANENFVPNDTSIGAKGEARLMILTGPNMGGKSTLMRQVGLITIMAQIGCHVPASYCELTLVDRIFTRLGANDDILAGQSTFLVELSETASILQHATDYSLVLLDELGRGTSTYDGTAIAASVVDALTKMDCRTLFSTHYHSLVEDFKANEKVTLAHMACVVEDEDEDQVSEENVTFLYKLSKGACPKSYGFNAARLAGISSEITKRAQEVATKLETEVNLRHAFTALCKAKDSSSLKSIFKKSIDFISKY
ncbi:hypothetical protein QAD02_010555 [Eretmocerus hayati]|uniref:Uncharacterized protein n=1 Tax=Eretmocerus hayati TaxID=131215 RepID=A0ACC2NU80_9HYME|nr:hypothetical protein QAD02_010555 [Eretmocerus hayati]